MNISPVTRSFQTVAVDQFKSINVWRYFTAVDVFLISHKNVERFLMRLLGVFFTLTGPLNVLFNIVPLSANFINMNNVDGDAKVWPSNEYNPHE